MAELPPGERRRNQVGGELILPAGAVAFTIYYFTTIKDAPWIAQVSALIVGIVLIVLCALFGIRTFLSVYLGELSLGLEHLIEPRAYVPKRLMLLALTLGYIYVIPWLGFTLTTFLFLMFAMSVLSEGRRFAFIVALSVFLSLGAYLLFVVAFQTRFPMGPVEAVLNRVF
jgi:Tripartite tricarboxylate transporter TctB family